MIVGTPRPQRGLPLLDEQRLRRLDDLGLRIALSLDGDAEGHAARIDAAGRSSHAAADEALEFLTEAESLLA